MTDHICCSVCRTPHITRTRYTLWSPGQPVELLRDPALFVHACRDCLPRLIRKQAGGELVEVSAGVPEGQLFA